MVAKEIKLNRKGDLHVKEGFNKRCIFMNNLSDINIMKERKIDV